jgi:predicted dehydrogenase
MVEAVEKAGVRSLTCYNYRRAPAVYEAKRLVEEGGIGRVYHFRGLYLQDYAIDPNLPLSWRFQKDKAGSGSLGDIGSHTLDMALFLVGGVDSISAITKTFIHERPVARAAQDVLATKRGKGSGPVEKGPVDIDDVTAWVMEFENGATGTMEASRFAWGHKNQLGFEINGERGSIRFNWERPAELLFYSSGDPDHAQGFRTILTGPPHPFGEYLWPLSGFGVGYPETTILMMNEFLECISEKKENPTNFRAGYENCAIMDAVLESAQKGKKIKVQI